jgi:hypothetical protein
MNGRTKVAVFALIVLARSISACICVGGTPKEKFQSSDVVVVGEVLDYKASLLTLHILECFKGPLNDAIIIGTSQAESCPGIIRPLPGAKLLVYAIADSSAPNLTTYEMVGCGPVREPQLGPNIRLLRHRAWWWRHTKQPTPPAPKPGRSQLNVKLTHDGTILVYGKPENIEFLKDLLLVVKRNHGVVFLEEEKSSNGPTPKAIEVRKAIKDSKVRVRHVKPAA